MRRIAAARLKYCGLGAMIEDVLVIVSDLVTNSILHGGTTEISLKVTLQEDRLRINVHDGIEGSIKPKQPNDSAETGRGFALVSALVQESGGDWGVSEDGTTIWCLLPAREGRQ
ncbi:ATP-binding protein [Streptomyces sp. NPDC052101]|uniref:ATP-binding protein n=1 Tax=Streptomyces sp. NPDC052101 TaxID=3155763 RepID=UPI00344A2AC9